MSDRVKGPRAASSAEARLPVPEYDAEACVQEQVAAAAGAVPVGLEPFRVRPWTGSFR